MDERQIGIFNIRGRLYGLGNVCPHQLGPLCQGTVTGTIVAEPGARGNWERKWVLDGEILVCPWHGLEFHIPSGRCIAFPRMTARSYEVVIAGNDVIVKL